MISRFIHNHRIQKFYSNLINKNQLCFDIGANVGKKSKILLNTGARVIAFEPQEECVPKLNLLKAKYANFEFLSIAISDTAGHKDLFISNYSEIATLSNSFVDIYKSKNINWLKKKLTETITINKAISLYGLPYFCKVDVEGHEFNILSVLKHSIPLIEFEVVAGFQKKAIELLRKLDKEGTTYNFTLNEQPNFSLDKWVAIDTIITVIEEFPKEQVHANIFIKQTQ